MIVTPPAVFIYTAELFRPPQVESAPARTPSAAFVPGENETAEVRSFLVHAREFEAGLLADLLDRVGR